MSLLAAQQRRAELLQKRKRLYGGARDGAASPQLQEPEPEPELEPASDPSQADVGVLAFGSSSPRLKKQAELEPDAVGDGAPSPKQKAKTNKKKKKKKPPQPPATPESVRGSSTALHDFYAVSSPTQLERRQSPGPAAAPPRAPRSAGGTPRKAPAAIDFAASPSAPGYAQVATMMADRWLKQPASSSARSPAATARDLDKSAGCPRVIDSPESLVQVLSPTNLSLTSYQARNVFRRLGADSVPLPEFKARLLAALAEAQQGRSETIGERSMCQENGGWSAAMRGLREWANDVGSRGGGRAMHAFRRLHADAWGCVIVRLLAAELSAARTLNSEERVRLVEELDPGGLGVISAPQLLELLARRAETEARGALRVLMATLQRHKTKDAPICWSKLFRQYGTAVDGGCVDWRRFCSVVEHCCDAASDEVAKSKRLRAAVVLLVGSKPSEAQAAAAAASAADRQGAQPFGHGVFVGAAESAENDDEEDQDEPTVCLRRVWEAVDSRRRTGVIRIAEFTHWLDELAPADATRETELSEYLTSGLEAAINRSTAAARAAAADKLSAAAAFAAAEAEPEPEHQLEHVEQDEPPALPGLLAVGLVTAVDPPSVRVVVLASGIHADGDDDDAIEWEVTPEDGEPLLFGRGIRGLPAERLQVHRRHAQIVWEAERGPVVVRLGKNQVGILRDGQSLRVSKVEEGGTVLQDDDVLFFLSETDDLKYNITVLPKPELPQLEATRTQKGIAMLTGAGTGPNGPTGAAWSRNAAAGGGGEVPDDWKEAFGLFGELIGGGDGTGSRLSVEAIHAALRHVGLTVGELEMGRWCTGAWHQLRSGQAAMEGSPRGGRSPGARSLGVSRGDVTLTAGEFVGAVSAGADWLVGWTSAAEACSAATKLQASWRGFWCRELIVEEEWHTALLAASPLVQPEAGGDGTSSDTRLPPGWGMKRSRTTGLPYFVNLLTMEPNYQRPTQTVEDPANPLPPGWEVAWSRSTDAVYYFHADSGESMYSHPGSIARVEGARTPPRRSQSPTRLTTGRSTDSTEAEAQRQKLMHGVWDSLAVSPASPAGKSSPATATSARARAGTPEMSDQQERSSPAGGSFSRSPIARSAAAAGGSDGSPEWGSPMYR